MNGLYYYETIEECEKEIIDKSIVLDLMHASNVDLFKCFVRTIRTIMIWIIIISSIMIFINEGFKPGIKILGILLDIYIIGKFLMSWVKFNYDNSYDKMKINLIDGIISKCKEYQEGEYEEWQKKQMLKRFAELANIHIDWDNAK